MHARQGVSPPVGFHIDLARRSDSPAIALLSRNLVESGLGWSWRASRVGACIARPDVVAAAARHRQGALAGFAIARFHADYAHLMLLAVDRRWQRRGLGAALVGWMEDTARVAGTFMMHLEMRETSESALWFYRAMGYTRYARLPRYYAGREAALRMYRDLRA